MNNFPTKEQVLVKLNAFTKTSVETWNIAVDTFDENTFGQYHGSSTAMLRIYFKIENRARAKFLKLMHTLEKENLVQSIKFSHGAIVWWPVGFLDELKAKQLKGKENE